MSEQEIEAGVKPPVEAVAPQKPDTIEQPTEPKDDEKWNQIKELAAKTEQTHEMIVALTAQQADLADRNDRLNQTLENLAGSLKNLSPMPEQSQAQKTEVPPEPEVAKAPEPEPEQQAPAGRKKRREVKSWI